MNEKIVKEAFDNWVAFLKETNNESLLTDPYGIWLEAFHVFTILKSVTED
jgi:hypothetical protein